MLGKYILFVFITYPLWFVTEVFIRLIIINFSKCNLAKRMIMFGEKSYLILENFWYFSKYNYFILGNIIVVRVH